MPVPWMPGLDWMLGVDVPEVPGEADCANATTGAPASNAASAGAAKRDVVFMMLSILCDMWSASRP